MTIHHLLRILAARRWVIAACVLLGVAAAIVYLQVTPKRYVATASIFVTPRNNDPLSLGSAQSQAAVSVSTQAEIIKRPRVAHRVVKDLGLDQDAKSRAAWVEAGSPGEFVAWLGDAVAGGVSTVIGSDSTVIDINYRSADPRYAARMANAFAAAYLATTLELRTDPARQYVTFFDQRITELRNNLERAQSRLADFEKETGLVSDGGKLDVENARLSELSSQLAAAQGSVADASSRQRGTEENPSASPEIMQNAVVQSLRGQVAAQQVKVAEMSLKLGPGHPAYVQAQGELAELRARLNAEIAQVSRSVSTGRQISGDRLAETQRAFDEQRQRVLSLQANRNQADVLQREVENAQRAYDLLLARQTQTTLDSQAQQTDASLLDQATIPAHPSFPNAKLTVLLAVVAGLLLGVVLALGLEFFSPMIRNSEDLITYTGLPVLAIVPSARLRRLPRMSLLGAPIHPATP